MDKSWKKQRKCKRINFPHLNIVILVFFVFWQNIFFLDKVEEYIWKYEKHAHVSTNGVGVVKIIWSNRNQFEKNSSLCIHRLWSNVLVCLCVGEIHMSIMYVRYLRALFKLYRNDLKVKPSPCWPIIWDADYNTPTCAEQKLTILSNFDIRPTMNYILKVIA